MAEKKARSSGAGEDSRKRYDALKLYQPFERVEAAFRPADLDFLLTGTDRLKITYLADHQDLPSGVRLREWVEYGVIAAHARLASKAGYTPKTLDEAVDLAASMGPDMSRQGWLEILIKHPATKTFLTSCSASDIDGPWLEAALESGATLQVLRVGWQSALNHSNAAPYNCCEFVRKGTESSPCFLPVSTARWY